MSLPQRNSFAHLNQVVLIQSLRKQNVLLFSPRWDQTVSCIDCSRDLLPLDSSKGSSAEPLFQVFNGIFGLRLYLNLHVPYLPSLEVIS